MGNVKAKVVFCDDIRQEFNGKFILVGVYVGEMVVQGEPGIVPISTWVELSGLSTGHHQAHIKAIVVSENEKTIAGEAKIDMSIARPDLPVALTPTGLLINVKGDCSVILFIKLDDEEELQAGMLKIISQPAPDAA